MFFAKFLNHRIKNEKSYDEEFVIAQCACISDGAALGKKFSARIEKIKMDDIAKENKNTGRDSINRDDPDGYMRSRPKEDFNSI